MENISSNRIDFTNDIKRKKLLHKGEHYLRYDMKKQKKGDFDILDDISENVTLVQLMDTLRNMILGYCLFDYNYEQEFF